MKLGASGLTGRIRGEVKRRTEVVDLVPDEAVTARLIGTLPPLTER